MAMFKIKIINYINFFNAEIIHNNRNSRTFQTKFVEFDYLFNAQGHAILMGFSWVQKID